MFWREKIKHQKVWLARNKPVELSKTTTFFNLHLNFKREGTHHKKKVAVSHSKSFLIYHEIFSSSSNVASFDCESFQKFFLSSSSDAIWVQNKANSNK